MNKLEPIAEQEQAITRYSWLLVVLWTAAVAASLVWNLEQTDLQVLEIARTQARVAHDKDIAYRRWNAGHGGVYAPVTETTQPNPHLDVAERDITTPSGRKLTLLNPAYMTRQSHELSREESGVLGHMTSLRPLRPENAPDPWEREALGLIERGANEHSSITEIDGVEYLRLMRPLMTTRACLRCHGQQGYQVGDVRGGISASVPMAPLRAIARQQQTTVSVGHSILWLLGTLGLILGTRILRGGIRERAKAVRKEIRLAAAVEQASDAIVVTNSERSIQYVNPAYEHMTGQTSDETIGREVSDADVGGETTGGVEEVWRVVGDGTPWQGRFTSERKDGTTYEEVASVSPVRDGKDQIIAYVILKRDVSKEMDLQAQLSQAQKLEAIGSLAAGIAHEINTPTQFIGDNAHFLQESFEDINTFLAKSKTLVSRAKVDSACLEEVKAVESTEDEIDLAFLMSETPEAIEHCLEGVKRVSEIVQAMKEFSHPGSSSFELVDLNHAIASTATVCRNRWKYVADLETDFCDDIPLVPCLAGEINQVVLNLIVNAADAIADKLGPVEGDDGMRAMGKISIRTRLGEDRVLISVTDTGTGMPESVKNRIFDHFFTTKEVGRGSGQGLSISRSVVVDKHGGEITLESEVGVGTTFTVALPLESPVTKADD